MRSFGPLQCRAHFDATCKEAALLISIVDSPVLGGGKEEEDADLMTSWIPG